MWPGRNAILSRCCYLMLPLYPLDWDTYRPNGNLKLKVLLIYSRILESQWTGYLSHKCDFLFLKSMQWELQLWNGKCRMQSIMKQGIVVENCLLLSANPISKRQSLTEHCCEWFVKYDLNQSRVFLEYHMDSF